MKALKYILYSMVLVFAGACTQEVIDLKEPEPPAPDTSCEDAEGLTGTANFTKFVAIGNSFVAGVQGGALFTDGQNNSLPAIINRQMDCVRGSTSTFKQPTIGASLGWNLFITQPFLSDNTKPILGRMLLQYGTTPDCATGAVSAKPTPQAYAPGNLEALPNPTFNPGFIYTGSKTELNNFAVPAITVGQALTPAAGDWTNQPLGFTPFYARFASNPGTSMILTDIDAAGGSFALVWLGLDDFFLYAAFGGDPTKAPLTSSGDFQTRISAIFAHPSIGLFTVNPNMQAVVGNFPNIFAMPHFTAVSYNPVPLDQATVTALMGAAAFGGYNTALDGLIANAGAFGISDELKAEIATRKVNYTVSCTNKMLIIDETLTDLGPYFDGLQGAGAISAEQRAGLVPYEQVRQTTSTDIIPLSTGSFIGTQVGGNPLLVNGVSVPLADQYVLIPSEIQEINNARTAYNAVIAGLATNFTTKLALADVDAALNTLITNKAAIYNGVTITPNINPPTGIYSEDGVHPNTRGYAFLSRVFIQAINTKFGSSIPLTNLGDYQATGLPIPAAE